MKRKAALVIIQIYVSRKITHSTPQNIEILI